MDWTTLDDPPQLAPLYWRAAVKRRITGSHLPEHGFRCRVSVNPEQVAAYRHVCGFATARCCRRRIRRCWRSACS